MFLGGSGAVRNNRNIAGNWALAERPTESAGVSGSILEDGCDHGGGFAVSGSVALTVVARNAITGNSAPFGGGIASCVDAGPELTDNIIANNSAGEHPCGDLSELSGVGGGIYCSELLAGSGAQYHLRELGETATGRVPASAPACTAPPRAARSIQPKHRSRELHRAMSRASAGIFCEDAASVPVDFVQRRVWQRQRELRRHVGRPDRSQRQLLARSDLLRRRVGGLRASCPVSVSRRAPPRRRSELRPHRGARPGLRFHGHAASGLRDERLVRGRHDHVDACAGGGEPDVARSCGPKRRRRIQRRRGRAASRGTA